MEVVRLVVDRHEGILAGLPDEAVGAQVAAQVEYRSRALRLPLEVLVSGFQLAIIDLIYECIFETGLVSYSVPS